MRAGQQRKHLVKLARRVPVEQVEGFLFAPPGEHPCTLPARRAHPYYFVLRQCGFEVLCGWGHLQGGGELIIEDEVFCQACHEYLRERGLLFDSREAAEQYAREHHLPTQS